MILNTYILIIIILLSVAFLTLFERKILGYIQIRKGPNKVGFKGLLQPFSDAIKLLSKEWYFLDYRNYLFFILRPLFIFLFSIILWLIYPWYGIYNIENNIIFFVIILGIRVFPIFLIGWNSRSNYAILGSLRLISQIISFEIRIFLIIYIFILLIESYSFCNTLLYQINIKFIILIYPLYLIIIIRMLIELNRTPFDLIEGESELVSGFNVEYYRRIFVIIFLSEYSGILLIRIILTIIFYGFLRWSIKFLVIYIIHIIIILWIRGILPRIRYDELIYICWIDLLFVVLIYLINIYIIKYLLYIIF